MKAAFRPHANPGTWPPCRAASVRAKLTMSARLRQPQLPAPHPSDIHRSADKLRNGRFIEISSICPPLNRGFDSACAPSRLWSLRHKDHVMTPTNGAPELSHATNLGFRTLGIEHKQAMVDEVFDRVAPRYDLMNDLMSGGLHRVWRDILVTAVNPPRNAQSFSVLDAAGGTADVGLRIVEAGGGGTRVTVCDIN